MPVNNYGLLINKDIKLHRTWFKQMVALHGINCNYYAPKTSSTFDIHGDLQANYFQPQTVGVIFEQYPDQKTLRKMGWVAQLQQGSSIIHVPYDLPNLQVGALFDIPSALQGAERRLFRVISMQTIMIYPASIACQIALEYETDTTESQVADFAQSDFTMLRDNQEDD